MKRVFYAEHSFLTDPAVADALLHYARVLATVGQADVVAVPGVDEDGELREFQMLIGPASQMLARETDDEPVAVDAEAVVRDLAARVEQRLPTVGAEVLVGPDGDASPSHDGHRPAPAEDR